MAVDRQKVLAYMNTLSEYLDSGNEQSLYKVELMSQTFIQNNILPGDIVNIHIQAMEGLYPEYKGVFHQSLNFLLEAMIIYGTEHKAYRTLQEKQGELESEIAVAANIQETLLKTDIPDNTELEIGVKSAAARRMSGDYYHFKPMDDGTIGVSIADVVGKGVPAALCMSMIKYAMDSFADVTHTPSTTLEQLNRVVEVNVDATMFITMFYAKYCTKTHTLYHATAGHEPGFFYSAHEDKFYDVDSRGLVLGILPDTTYHEREFHMDKGDMAILLTDGVTECRQDDKFMNREDILQIIKKYIHLPAQEMVERIYAHFEQIQNYQLRDDFTLIVLRRHV